MSIAIDVNTITTSLWPSVGRVTRTTGQFLEVNLINKGITRFSHIVFDPNDESLFYASTTDSIVYVFSLRNNFVKLFATLEFPISAIACCTNCNSKSLFICSTEDNSIVWIESSTSRIIRREKTPHHHIINYIKSPPGVTSSWLVTLSKEVIAIWDVTRMICKLHSYITTPNILHNFMNIHAEKNVLITIEYSGRIKLWNSLSLISEKAVTIDIKPRSFTVCPSYIAIGSTDAMIGFLKTQDLSFISSIQISHIPVAICYMNIINNDLLACELTDGTIFFIFTINYTVAFVMAAPYSGAIPKGPAICNLSGPSFIVFAHGEKLTVFHLPTARQYYLRRNRNNNNNNGDINPSLQRQIYPFVQEKNNIRLETPLLKEEKGENEEEIIGDTTLPRPSVKPSEQQVSKWVKVNMLPSNYNGVKLNNSVRDESPNKKFFKPYKKGSKDYQEILNLEKSTSNNNNNNNNKKELSLRPFLDKESRLANMKNLKQLLLRYGVFPDKYRSLIWRFLLQLPERRFTAPQYAQLVSKGTHKFVPFLMKPFPLQDNKIQESIKKILSILSWHIPMFSVIHFLPMIIFPFLQIYKDDIQSIVEIVLAFLSNWGQEIFQYYPHHPVKLITLLNQLLRTEDKELHNHLEQCGILAENWGWEAFRSIYTDILTSSTWLQVMDHAFFNKPLWLFTFHIRWLIQIRDKIIKNNDQNELMEILTTSHSININKVILEAYKLYEKCSKEEEIMKPYCEFKSFINYAYPNFWKYNEEAINQKILDLEKFIKQKEQIRESRRRIHSINEQFNQAELLEDVFVEKKRAEVSAQLSSVNDNLRNEIVREKENQKVRDIESMVRLKLVQQQLHRASRLESLQEELSSARLQLTDLVNTTKKEKNHWKGSERLSDYELQKLEEAARERLANALKAIEDEEKNKILQIQEDKNSHLTSIIEPNKGTIQTQLNEEIEKVVEIPNTPLETYRILQNNASKGVISSSSDIQVPKSFNYTSSPTPHNIMNDIKSNNIGRVVQSPPIYDNLLDTGKSINQIEKEKLENKNFQSKEVKKLNERDERSSAGTVLLRPRDPEAYRLPRSL